MTDRRCYYCQAKAVEQHHHIPRCYGGTDDPENLVDVCRSCHRRVHMNDWAEWGRLGGLISVRRRRKRAGSYRVFCAQMRQMALSRWQVSLK
jgi:hypothetical protein